MPRKTSIRRHTEQDSACFNEAAARCRGKHDDADLPSSVDRLASMRPRPDAAENIAGGRMAIRPPTRFNEAAARCRGKHCG